MAKLNKSKLGENELMNYWKTLAIFAMALSALGCVEAVLADQPQSQTNDQPNVRPNILWILTDDHRYDSIRAFNQMLTGQQMSKLGYVESPNTDRLAKMGTTFINTYCQAMGCAPSRASLHYGRYPFRSGIYGFEYHNNNAQHCRPTLPESMAAMGYQTTHIGKLGVRVRTINNGGTRPHSIYQQSFYFKDLAKDGLCGWGKDWFQEINGVKFDQPFQSLEFFVTPEGKFEYCSLELEKVMPEFAGTTEKTMEKYDLLRHYNQKKGKHIDKGMILSGVSARQAGKTRDGYYASIFGDYLKHTNRKFEVGTQTYQGVDTSKPLFCHIGFDFPHTPVLPPADFRKRFQQQAYKVPVLDEKELETMPKQLKKMIKHGFSDHFTDAEKLAMIQDYYAFCAYGDRLIGQSVDAFIEYSQQQKQPWVILYVVGDHGWKLNDHGSVSKFTPWDIDCHNPIIVLSSDKQTFPADRVVREFTEFVDVAPTILAAAGADINGDSMAYLDGVDLAKVVSGEHPARDYVIGESHAVTGPRAYIRTKDFVFSMQTRPHGKKGKNMQWAQNVSFKDLDPALYHLSNDPGETNNVALNKEYEQVAMALKDKLTRIVLGDNRVEVDWGSKGEGTELFGSNFAPGADDKKLDF